MRNRLPLAGLAGVIALVAAAPATARPFYIVQSGPDSWTVMDPQGIEREGTIAKAWAVRVQRNILSGNPPQAGYVRTLTEYDCTQNRALWREVYAFSRSGQQLVHTVNPSPDWAPIDTDSDIRAAWRVVCEGVGGGAVISAESVAKVVISLMGSWDPPTPPPAAAGTPSAPPAKAAAPPKAAPPAKAKKAR